MILARNNYKRRDRLTLGINTLDYRDPFSISRLRYFRLSTSVCTREDHSGRDNAHHKAGLVEVEHVRRVDTILSYYILYKRKPAANKLRIFA